MMPWMEKLKAALFHFPKMVKIEEHADSISKDIDVSRSRIDRLSKLVRSMRDANNKDREDGI